MRHPTYAEFLGNSDWLDHETTHKLDHIFPNWELTWDFERERYVEEPDSFAALVNALIDELEAIGTTLSYHQNEDALAEYVRDVLHEPVTKQGNRWLLDGSADRYDELLERGGLGDVGQRMLVAAIAGRIQAAISHGQNHFEEMEQRHQRILAWAITSVLFYRADSLRG